MNLQEPWAEKWSIQRELGKGGQGLTLLVSALDEPTRVGVLKKLKKNDSDQARRRMFQEVAALRTLFAAGVKVPQVHDANTDQFDQPAVPLYFVMDYVAPGTTLKELVRERGKLPLEKAVALTLDLCATIAAAHKEKVLHRDIKPDNIIVRNFDNNDLVIVDFGLSFNHADRPDESISETGERIGNRFLPLPEAQLRGGDRRDHRSDLTYLSGILYFCLTGHYPDQFRDGRNRPPHRSEGFTAREALPDDPRVDRLENFFDLAFEQDVDSRFQTIEALISRLEGLLVPSPEPVADPAAVEAQIMDGLLRGSRQAQLVRLGHYAEELRQRLHSVTGSCFQGLTHFHANFRAVALGAQATLPPGRERTAPPFAFDVHLRGYHQWRIAIIEFAAQGAQCCLLRTTCVPLQQGVRFEDWQEEVCYAREQPPSEEVLLGFMKRALVRAMNSIREELDGGP